MTRVWPPPADDASVWREFTPQGSREPVRAREVPLWGRPVFVADVEGESRVWCPDCRRFLSLAVLGRPYSGHSVGVRTPPGTVVTFESGDDGPLPALRTRYHDLMREPW